MSNQTQTEVVPGKEQAQKVCENTLRNLGYEVVKPQTVQQGIDFNIKKGTIQYSLFVAFAFTEPQSEKYFRIPIGSMEDESDHIFNMKADCIAFYQQKYEEGTIFQFKLDEMRNLLLPIVEKLKATKTFAFQANNAIEKKRIHACPREDGKGYILYIYLPIESVCKNLKNMKQHVGK